GAGARGARLARPRQGGAADPRAAPREPVRDRLPDALRAAGDDGDLPGHQMPPMQRYFVSSQSSMPYLEPSRPMPDSFTPPNGATSVDTTPVLIPRIPYSSASEIRQMRPMSRA